MKVQLLVSQFNRCNPFVKDQMIAFTTHSHKKIALMASGIFSGLALICLLFHCQQKIKKSNKTIGPLNQKVNQPSPVVEKNPQPCLKDIDTLKNKNDQLLSQGKIKEAEQNWKEIFSINSDSSIIIEQYVKVLFKNGENLFDQGKLTEALKKYKIVMDIEPQNIAAALKYAEILNLQGKGFQAEEKYKEILASKLDEKTKRYIIARYADALMNQDKLKEAEVKFKEVLKDEPNDSFALGRLVMIEQFLGKMVNDNALTQYEKLLTINPKDVFCLIALAVTSFYLDKITSDEQEEFLKNAYLLDPKFAFMNYVRSLNENGNKEEAKKILHEILALDPENMNARQLYAKNLYKNGDIEKSIEQCELGLSIDPYHKEISKYYFLNIEKSNDFETMESIYQKYIAQYPKNFVILNCYAEYLQKNGGFDLIPEKFRNILKLNLEVQDDLNIYVDAISEYVKKLCIKSNFKEAEKLLNQILQSGIKNSVIEKKYAQVLHCLGKHGEAAKHWKIILKNDPNDIPSLNHYASVLYALNKYDAAKEILDNVLKIDPDNVLAIVGYYQILLTQGFQDAAEDFKIDFNCTNDFFEYAYSELNEILVENSREFLTVLGSANIALSCFSETIGLDKLKFAYQLAPDNTYIQQLFMKY